jgi:lantibiotic modifying enzyme
MLAGARLLELGRAEHGGLKWAMNPTFARLMPNFSHGTAGIAYFLAALYQTTREPRFLEGALAGARYVQAIAATEGDICLVMHHEPQEDGRSLYYLGWCHGPAGTARLFYQLSVVTRDPSWMTWVRKSARGVLASGIPDREQPGFWNNVGQCCGSAGVADFVLSLHRATGDPEYLAFARRLTDALVAKVTKDERGARWTHAEHRSQPALLVAQTGWMQGAAGIGAWLLRMDAVDRGGDLALAFPDSPF